MFVRYLLLLSFAFCKGLFYENDPFDPYSECPDQELRYICTDQCEAKTLNCILNCPSDDTNCISDCLREDTLCIEDCPCEINCQEGCTDCPNPVCQCKDVKENEEWNRCRRANGDIWTLCIFDCNDNKSCEDQCTADYKIRQADCPCEANCPAGCPCDEFNCLETTTSADVSTSTAPMTTKTATTTSITTTTTTSTTTPATPNAVLVLSTYTSSNKPMVVTFDGVVNDNLDFEYGSGTEAYYGCGVTFKGQFWYLGGSSYKRQVSKIVGCQLVAQPGLSFDFNIGACNTFQSPDEKALMCFGDNAHKECHIFDGVDFTSAASSKCDHLWGGLANYKGQALTTGSNANSACYVRSELYDFNTNQWTDAPNYPFATRHIVQYAVASTDNAAFIIGGYDQNGSGINIIAKFQDNEWTRYGSLKATRRLHGSIQSGDQTMIIGGDSSGDVPTEVWNFNNGDNKIIQPTLPDYQYAIGIGLYLVDADFCKK